MINLNAFVMDEQDRDNFLHNHEFINVLLTEIAFVKGKEQDLLMEPED